MNKEVMDKVDEYIQALADSLGVASEYVFETLVRQQVISGIVDILGVILVAIVGWVVIKLITKPKHKANSKSFLETTSSDELLIWGYWIIVVVYVIVLIIGILMVPSAIKHIMNPEYYAIKELLEVLK